jgi:hypothetical protein
MKKALSSIVGILAFAGVGVCAAIPQCTAVLNVDVNTLNTNGGCIVGEYLFNNFDWTAAGIAPNQGPVILTGIFSDPANSNYGLVFNPQLFGVAPATPADIHLTFSVTNATDPTIPDVYQVGLLVPGGPANVGQGTHVQETGCAIPVPQDTGACPAGSLLFSATAFAGQSVPVTQAVPVNKVWIWKDLNASDPRIASQLSSFTETFQAPEPGTIALFGAALLAFGLARRKF